MGMFGAIERMKEEKTKAKYAEKLEGNKDEVVPVPRRGSVAVLHGMMSKPKTDEELAAARRRSETKSFEEMNAIQRRHSSMKAARKAMDPLLERPVLKHKLDIVLGPDRGDEVDENPFLENLKQFAKRAAVIEKNSYFVNLITLTIVLVAIQIGVETDELMSCGRATLRGKWKSTCYPSTFSTVMTGLSQAIFTIEMLIKIAAKGAFPEMYFEDPWNCLDSFVVVVGFIEMTPAYVVFEAFPVVVLRLLRLLRVFRLAKALPRLASIVEALMAAFGAVGWVVVLMLVFNYIWGCICMLLMGANDPFHFGYILKLSLYRPAYKLMIRHPLHIILCLLFPFPIPIKTFLLYCFEMGSYSRHDHKIFLYTSLSCLCSQVRGTLDVHHIPSGNGRYLGSSYVIECLRL